MNNPAAGAKQIAEKLTAAILVELPKPGCSPPEQASAALPIAGRKIATQTEMAS